MMDQQESYSTGSGQQGGPSGTGGDNLGDLIRQLTHQGSHLAGQQLELVKAEVREAKNDLVAAIGAMAGAAVVGIAGLGVVLMGLSYLLAGAIDERADDTLGNTGLATLIVGVATLILAYILYAAGKKKLDTAHLTPDRTVRTLERTPDAARGDLTTEHTQ